MQSNQPLQEYVKRNVEGASQGDLILLLYDAGINFMSMGKSKLAGKDLEGAHNALARSIRVVEELIGSLNLEKGGEIAKNLLSLYAYIKRRLTQANTAKEDSGINEALELMGGLRGAWRKALDQRNGANQNGERPADVADAEASRVPHPTPKPLNISI